MLIVGIQTNLNPYVTSAFSQHALLSTTGIVASILGGSSSLAIAKIIDIWGRFEGFLVMLLLVVLGLIVKAACQNVETYAAAHTFYWVGHLGLIYVIDIILADMTSLRNRMIMFGINGTPTIASTFAGPAIAELFYLESSWRWAYGAFCIIIVAACIPAAAVMLLNQRKAARLGVLPERASGRAWLESIKHYCIEFDGKPRLYRNRPKLISSSCRHYTHDSRLLVDFASLQPRSIGSTQMGKRRHHRDDSHWAPMPGCFRALGEVLRSCAVLSLQVPQRSHYHRIMSAIWVYVPLNLVSLLMLHIL